MDKITFLVFAIGLIAAIVFPGYLLGKLTGYDDGYSQGAHDAAVRLFQVMPHSSDVVPACDSATQSQEI